MSVLFIATERIKQQGIAHAAMASANNGGWYRNPSNPQIAGPQTTAVWLRVSNIYVFVRNSCGAQEEIGVGGGGIPKFRPDLSDANCGTLPTLVVQFLVEAIEFTKAATHTRMASC